MSLFKLQQLLLYSESVSVGNTVAIHISIFAALPCDAFGSFKSVFIRICYGLHYHYGIGDIGITVDISVAFNAVYN